jgi:hypothetical protein
MRLRHALFTSYIFILLFEEKLTLFFEKITRHIAPFNLNGSFFRDLRLLSLQNK